MQRMRLGAYVNYGARHLSALAQVHRRTAQRWIDSDSAPACVVELLDLLISGNLARIHPQWSGWLLRDGLLRTPDGYAELTPHNLHALPWLLQLARTLSAPQTEQQPEQHAHGEG